MKFLTQFVLFSIFIISRCRVYQMKLLPLANDPTMDAPCRASVMDCSRKRNLWLKAVILVKTPVDHNLYVCMISLAYYAYVYIYSMNHENVTHCNVIMACLCLCYNVFMSFITSSWKNYSMVGGKLRLFHNSTMI